MATSNSEHLAVTRRTEQLVLPIIEELGLSLWDVTFQKEGVDWCLTVFIDKDGGADLNDCEAVSRALDPLLDEADFVDCSYYLQVFTPGLERRLTKEAHFAAYMGQKILLRSIRPVNGERDFAGILQAYDGKKLTLKAGEESLAFPTKSLAFVKADDFDDAETDAEPIASFEN